MAEPETEGDLVLPDAWVQTCFVCKHAMFGEQGTYCPVFDEQILSERAAGEDCPSFESNDGRAYINIDPQEET